jgi:hypothetical protein
LDFNLVIVGMRFIFGAPVAAHEIVLRHEVSFYCQRIPMHALLLGRKFRF